MKPATGKVFLVGAGPGDPGLITVRGLSVLQTCDVVVHDRLIARELLSLVRSGAEVIDAGKVRGVARMSQEQIEALIVERALRGLRVVRLKGGDPFVFGRGFEELTACRTAGVACEVVPGVSSAIAGPIAAGIPITQRGVSRSFAVMTGSSMAGGDAPDLEFSGLSSIDTVIVLMGREHMRTIAERFMAAGRDGSTPVACIQDATTPRQRVVSATLDGIADAADRAGLDAPMLTVIGEVAARSVSSEQWLSSPLAGKRIVLTRPPRTQHRWLATLSALGASVISCPLIDIAPVSDVAELDESIQGVSRFDWLVFTSQHAVKAFWQGLDRLGFDARKLSTCRIAAVGRATADALNRRGCTADLVPAVSTGEGLCGALCEIGSIHGARVLYPRSDIARLDLADGLRRAGSVVEEVIAYQTVPLVPSGAARALIEEGIDAVFYCSPSAVRRFIEERLPLGNGVVACLGHTTAAEARTLGLSVQIVAREATLEGIVEGTMDYFATAVAPT